MEIYWRNKTIHNIHLIKRTREKNTVYTDYGKTNINSFAPMQKWSNTAYLFPEEKLKKKHLNISYAKDICSYIEWQHIDPAGYII